MCRKFQVAVGTQPRMMGSEMVCSQLGHQRTRVSPQIASQAHAVASHSWTSHPPEALVGVGLLARTHGSDNSVGFCDLLTRCSLHFVQQLIAVQFTTPTAASSSPKRMPCPLLHRRSWHATPLPGPSIQPLPHTHLLPSLVH